MGTGICRCDSALAIWEGPFPGYAHFEDVPNHIGCDLVHYPVMLIVRVFEVAIRRIGTQRFAGFTLCLEHRTDFLTGVLGVPFVDDIKKRSKIAVLLIGAVHAVVDGNESNICAGQHHLGVVTYLEVVSAQSAHVLYDDRTDLALVHKSHKALPIRAVEIGAAVAIVNKIQGVSEAIVISEFLEDSLLIQYGIAIPLQFIVTGQTAVQCRDFIRRNSGGLSI